MITVSLFKVSMSPSILLLSPLNILITIVFNSLSGRLLASILLNSVLGEFSCFFICGMLFCLHILAASLCFCVLGRPVTSLSLDMLLVLHSRCLNGSE